MEVNCDHIWRNNVILVICILRVYICRHIQKVYHTLSTYQTSLRSFLSTILLLTCQHYPKNFVFPFAYFQANLLALLLQRFHEAPCPWLMWLSKKHLRSVKHSPSTFTPFSHRFSFLKASSDIASVKIKGDKGLFAVRLCWCVLVCVRIQMYWRCFICVNVLMIWVIMPQYLIPRPTFQRKMNLATLRCHNWVHFAHRI